MVKILPFVLLCLLSAFVSAQTDSVFTASQLAPVTGTVSIDYKKQVVSVNQTSSPRELAFREIREVRLQMGKYYVGRNLRGETQLFVLLIQGRYSLLYQEKKRIFYVEKEDSIKIISQDHIELALPLIFGQSTIEGFNQRSNQKPEYSFNYLKKLTSYANDAANAEQVVFQQNFKQFKPKVYIGIYAGINSNGLSLTSVTQDSRTEEYPSTPTYRTASIPVGISIHAETSPRIGWELNAYYNKVTLRDLSKDTGGLPGILATNLYYIPKSYKQTLKLEEYSFSAVAIDLSVPYFLIKKGKSRLSPYLSFGPGLSVMTDESVVLASRMIDSEEIIRRFNYNWNDSRRNNMMFSLNGGVGLNYVISQKIQLNVIAKYQRGRFPRILHTPKEGINLNPSDTMPVENPYINSYDQYTSTFFLGSSLVFKVL